MSNRASKEKMEELHKVVAESLADIIKNGTVDPETNKPVPAPAAYYANAIKLLKDNNIVGIISEKSPLAKLLESVQNSDILEELQRHDMRH